MEESLYCVLDFQINKELLEISMGVSVNGQTAFYPSCCGSFCVEQDDVVILTAHGIIANPVYQWFMCNAPILIGGTGQTYQPNTSTVGSILYTFILGQSGATISDPTSTLFCNITLNVVAPITPSISAIVNCSFGQILACDSTLNVCEGDIVSLSALPNSDCNNSYLYQWLVDGTEISTNQSITVCDEAPGTYTYDVLILYCCNIAINTQCSIVIVVSPKVTIVPIKNGTSIPFTCGDEIDVDKCDKLYLLAQTSEKSNVVWLRDNKIISTDPLIEVNTKHAGKFNYSVQIISEENLVGCSPCTTCSTVVNVKKQHKHH